MVKCPLFFCVVWKCLYLRRIAYIFYIFLITVFMINLFVLLVFLIFESHVFVSVSFNLLFLIKVRVNECGNMMFPHV
jgi:hypothetical protein